MRTPLLPALYIAALTSSAIAQPINVNTITPTTAATAFVGGVAYDPVTDEVWYFDEGAGVDLIEAFDRTTGALTISLPAPAPTIRGTTNPQPIGGVVDTATGNIWVADENEVFYEMDRAGNVLREFDTLPQINDVSAITMDPVTRTLFISNDSANIIGEHDMAGNQLGTFPVGPLGSVDADGLVYNPATQTFFLGEDTGDQIIEIDRSGAVVINTFSMVGILDVSAQCPAAPNCAPLTISPEGLAIDCVSGSMFIGGGFAQRSIFEVVGILAPSTGGSVNSYGTGCPDSGGSDPVLDVSCIPQISSAYAIGCQTGTPVGTNVAFFIGGPAGNPANVPLGIIGFPACTLLVNPITVATVPTTVNQRAGFNLAVGGDPVLQGATFFWQAAILESGGLAMSNGLSTVLQ